MVATNIILTAPETYSADIDGTVWYNITPSNHLYADIMEVIKAGAPVGTPPPPVVYIPNLSFPQLLIGLVTEGWISESDGEGWLVGTLPSAVLAVITTLPAEQRFAAKARATRPSEVVRSDPLVNALGTAEGKTSIELDEFFITYSAV